MGEQVQKIGILIVAILISMIALTVFSDSLLTNVTNPATDTVNVDTSASANITLTSPHWFTDVTEMTATGATTGTLSLSTATLDATRTILTYTAAEGAGAEDVTVTYVTEDSESQGTVGWKLVPLFLILLALFAIGGSIFVGVQYGRQGQIGSLLVSIAILFIGVILGEVVKTFSDDAIALYALQPDYTGVGTLLPIIDLGYVFALFGIAAGGVVGYGSKLFK